MTNASDQKRTRDPTPSESTSSEAQLQVFPASEARANFMEVINRVRYGRERLVVTNKGKAAAAIVTMEDLKLLQLLDDVDIKERIDARVKQESKAEDWDDYVRARSERSTG